MANTIRKAEVIITANAQQPTKIIEALSTAAKRFGEDLRREMDVLNQVEIQFGKTSAQFKAQKKVVDDLSKTITSLASATTGEIEKMKSLSDVIADLGNTKLRDLKRALGQGKNQLASLTGSSEDMRKADEIRQKMKLIGDQIRLIEGEYVEMAKVISNVGSVSDKTLDKAIKQQKDLVAGLEKTDAAYTAEIKILKQLEAEEVKRASARKASTASIAAQSSKQAAQNALNKVTGNYMQFMSQDTIEAGKKAMIEYQRTLQMGSPEWKQYGEAIAKAEAHLKSFTEQQKMTASQAMYAARTGLDDKGQKLNSNQIREAQSVLAAERNTARDPRAVQSYNEAIARLEKQFQQLNSTMTNTAKISGTAKDQLRQVLKNPMRAGSQDLSTAIKTLQDRLKGLDPASKAYDRLQKKIKELQQVVNGSVLTQEQFNKVVAKPQSASVDQLKKAYAMLQEKLNSMTRTNTKEYQKLQQMATRLRNEINSTTQAVQTQNSWFKNAIRNIGAYMGVFALFNAVKSKIQSVITLNMQFSDQLVNIRKVSGLAIHDVNNLSRELAKLDTRSSLKELSDIAYAGAKLGMGQYGTEGLRGFVEAANQVNVALKEDLGQDALTSLSKITEVMGLIPRLGVEKSLLATGSSMFKLASTSTATANNIVEFSKRLTGIARTAGITTDQILALGSASDSMMLMPEVASTAFNKLITSLQRNPKAIEESLNIPKGTINNLFKSGDAMQAIVTIFQKMKEKGNMSALNSVFKDLGSDGARLIAVMVTMAKNVDMLEKHLDTSRTAFQEATAVTKEYNMQQETAAGLMERANNIWEKAFVNPEGVDNVKELSKEWYDLSKRLTESKAWMFALKSSLAALLGTIKLLLITLPHLVFWMGAGGLVGAISSGVAAIRALGGVMTALNYGVLVLQKAFVGLSMVGRMTWIGAAIGLVAGLVSYFVEGARKASEFADAMGSLNRAAKEAKGAIYAQQQDVTNYVNAIERAKKGTKERAALIKGFNEAYGQYLSKLLSESSTTTDLATALTEVNKQLRIKGMLEAKQEWKKKNVTTRFEKAGERLETFGNIVGGSLQNRTANMTWLRTLVEGTQNIKTIQAAVEARFKQEAITEQMPDELRALVMQRNVDANLRRDAAMSYARQFFAARHYDQEADRVFGPDPKIDIPKENPGDLSDNDTNTGNVNQAADDARARIAEFITRIKNFYTRQMTAEIDRMTEEGIEKPLQDRAVQDIQERLQTALARAQQSIVLGRDAWEKFKTSMDKDLKEKDDEYGQSQSRILYDYIQAEDVKQLRADLLKQKAKIKKGKIVGYKSDESDAAYMERLWLNASGNEKRTATIEQRRAEARRKELMEHDYTGTVKQTSFEGLFSTGFVNPDTSNPKDYGIDKQKVIDMLENVRKDITSVLANEGDYNGLMSLLFGKDYEKEIEGSVLEPLLSMTVEDFRLFYSKLIQYSDQYTEAEKKAADERKKVYEFQWKNSGTYISLSSQIEDTGAQVKANKLLPNKGRSWTQANGFADITDDPEIKLLDLKMKLEREFFEFMKARGATEAQLAEQWRATADAANEYTQRIMQSVSERMEMMQTWTDPLVTFGGAMGEAFAQMGEDAEQGAQAVQDALKSMLRSWGEITIRIIAERMAQSMQQSLYNQMEESEEEKHQDKLTEIRTTGSRTQRKTAIAAANAIINAKMKFGKKEVRADQSAQDEIASNHQDASDAIVDIEESAGKAVVAATVTTGANLLATKKAQDQAEVTENAGKTEANMTMSLADAMGKCFAMLGPIGGPIAAAAVQALLMGLLNWALSAAFSKKSKSADKAANINTKLVSGMMTYDKGNLQQMYLGNDGKLYAAKNEDSLPTGIVTQPVATTINGQPSLVGERGPELVVGRETTAAMMQNAPGLLQALLDYDKNRRNSYQLYERGNVDDIYVPAEPAPDTQPAITQELLTQLLYYLQHPVAPNINMYGRDGLYEKSRKAERFMRGR